MYDIKYGPATANAMADCLSHLPLSLPDVQINDDIEYLQRLQAYYHSAEEQFETMV